MTARTGTIKPVGLCPRCKQVPRAPGRAYCAACQLARGREARAQRRRLRAKRAAREGAAPSRHPKQPN